MKNKIFKDPVHGYIKIPTELIDTFIDTALFQRLGRIEQTSMRCLFPATRHDRFIHSIGVFHLGRLAIDALFENTSDEILKKVFNQNGSDNGEGNVRDKYKEEIDKIKMSFYIACLMHDCAHSPFSHTYEDFYYTGYDNAQEAEKYFMGKIDGLIGTELAKQSLNAKPHEVVSSYVFIEWITDKYDDSKKLKKKKSKGNRRVKPKDKYKYNNFIFEIEPKPLDEDEKATEMTIDLELIVRCILGRYYYKDDDEYKMQFYNGVIDLLNSQSIDVDKLDYLIRDTFNSGVDNFSIDVDRFISSIKILPHPEKENEIVLGYKKTSLSILKSIIYARDHLFTWIYSHHKVKYQAEMQRRLLKNIDKKTCKGFIESAFDVKNFFEPKKYDCKKYPLNFYLVDDNDICYILKWLSHESDEYKCIFQRVHHVCMWKSYAEYFNVFKYTPFVLDEQIMIVKAQIEKLCVKSGYDKDDFVTVKSSYKEGYIHPNKTFIELDGKTKTIADLGNDFTFRKFKKEFFYLYMPKNITKDDKKELMEMIVKNI